MKTSRRACEEIQATVEKNVPPAAATASRAWTELRIRRADLVQDNVTLPIQRLREAVSDLIKTSDDKDIGQELIECNRRLGELKAEVAEFLSQSAEDHVYWVERAGKAQRNLALNAAPVDVADFLRHRLFETRHLRHHDQRHAGDPKWRRRRSRERPAQALEAAGAGDAAARRRRWHYFARRVGCESATQLQVGTPFDYERQMKLFAVKKMPDPREPGYADALVHWIEHFVKHDARQGVRAVHQLQADAGSRRADAAVFRPSSSLNCSCRAPARRARPCWKNSRTTWIPCCSARTASGRAWMCPAKRCPTSSSPACRLPCRTIR